MTTELEQELEAAIRSDTPLPDIVLMLRRHKARGASREEVYSFLSQLRTEVRDEAIEDRILEVTDFVAGFCAPHMKVWDS